MTKLTTEELKDAADVRFQKNSSGAITPPIQREQEYDSADSQLNHLDLTANAADDGKPLIVDFAARVVTPGNIPGSLRLTTDVKTADFQALPGQIVLVDRSSGPVTITAPSNPVENQCFAVKRIDSDFSPVLISAVGSNIEHTAADLVAGTQAFLIGRGSYAAWQFHSGTWRCVAVARSRRYREVWRATPITGISTDLIAWTHEETIPGIGPQLASHSAGVLTFATNFDAILSLSGTWDMVIAAADSDVTVSFDFGGTADRLIPDIHRLLTSPRAGTFRDSGSAVGQIAADLGTTLSLQANAVGQGSSSCNLVELTLSFSL